MGAADLRGGQGEAAADLDFAGLRANALAPRDGWWPVLVLDPLSIRLVWLLARRFPAVTPNQLTWLSGLCGLLAAAAFWHQQHVWGALLFFLHGLLDQMDGQLARATGRTSSLGRATDVLFDVVVYLLLICGLYLPQGGGSALALIGYGLAAFFGLHFALVELLKAPSLYDSARLESSGALPAEGDGDNLATSRVPWARVAPGFDAWLRRRRLMIPLLWPDRHAILFIFGPLTGWLLLAGAFALCLNAASFAFKVWKLFHLAAAADRQG